MYFNKEIKPSGSLLSLICSGVTDVQQLFILKSIVVSLSRCYTSVTQNSLGTTETPRFSSVLSVCDLPHMGFAVGWLHSHKESDSSWLWLFLEGRPLS